MLFPRFLRLLLEISKNNYNVVGLHETEINSNLSTYVKLPFLGSCKGIFYTHHPWCIFPLALQLTRVNKHAVSIPEPFSDPQGWWGQEGRAVNNMGIERNMSSCC